jgi:hypothetical protein
MMLAAISVCDLSAAALTGFPFTDEDLNYSVNWPSGLALGESHLHSRQSGANWNFELTIDAGVPGFQVKDNYKATSDAGFCSSSLLRDTSHGAKKVHENEPIANGTATRNGGPIPVPACVKDALTFLYYTRREMGQGRVPVSQQILLGGLYPIRLDYAGASPVTVAGKTEESDKVICVVTTASSAIQFEVYFARDAARTPLIIKVPLAMGSFSMELVR